ncbi:MAG TPA: sigma-70 family RNA polymerase sigma factor [Actinomycetota bacterium]|nr:sigma-70 family RNA polymerase sigma factor [Actinomycetota bacterium]
MSALTPRLAAAAAGEPWALEAIYEEFAPSVLGYLRAQSAAEPEDLGSEVFVAVVRGLSHFRGDERDFRSWVFSITHRRLMDERRRLARRRDEPADPADMTRRLAHVAAGDVEEEALGQLGQDRAIRAVAALTPDQRDVVLLRVLADLSVEETAEILGKRKGAVKTLQRRALRALAERFQREAVS